MGDVPQITYPFFVFRSFPSLPMLFALNNPDQESGNEDMMRLQMSEGITGIIALDEMKERNHAGKTR